MRICAPRTEPPRWMTGYDFPAAKAGQVIKKEFKDESGEPMQGYVMNMRRDQFKDRRVRQALTLLYDFEDQNRTQFFGLNKRLSSYFENSELASTGLPEGKELAILEPFRDKLPPELFTEQFKLPMFDERGSERQYLREAVQLFDEAGWHIQGGRMVNKQSGEQFRIEFLGGSPTAEVITGGFIANLRKIGIDATLRIVDTSQYIQRFQAFEFDAVTAGFPQSESPGNEQRDYWSSQAADTPGSRNVPGIRDEVVDALINRVIFATDREDLVAATRALDRVLLWNYYTIPQYYQPTMRYAYWNKFGIPAEQPRYVGIDTMSWWVLPENESKIEQTYQEAQ
jgi:microcin C transport system substrate-binding protein